MTGELEFIDEALAARGDDRRRRSRRAMGVSIAVLVIWLIFVTASGHWGRVTDRWVAAVTMIFGSIVAGSTPQGGGAVAFPVFTKVLEVDATVARTFSLCIQTIGMTAASLAIVASGRRVDWRSVRILTPLAMLGLVGAAFLLGEPHQLFWPSTLPGPYVKVTFTIVVAAMAVVVWMGSRSWLVRRMDVITDFSTRMIVLVALAGLAGGVASFLVGSGADVFTYLVLVALLGLSAGVGVPSSVVVMAAVSVVGFLLFGVLDGQLAIDLNDAGDVVAVGGDRLATPLPGDRYDLYGFWLAAVPVVAFGAPLGSWLASRVSDRALANVVVGLALAEIISTAIFLDDLRSDAGLAAYAVLGLVIAVAGVVLIYRHRHWLLGLPAVDVEASFTPRQTDVDHSRRKR